MKWLWKWSKKLVPHFCQCYLGMSQSVGCLPRQGIKALCDGVSVANLKRAGAIPIAVTNTPELCLCWESTNLITGRTNNPYDLHRTPGGSSGGEVQIFLYVFSS